MHTMMTSADEYRISASGLARPRRSRGQAAKQRRNQRRRAEYLLRRQRTLAPPPDVLREFTVEPPPR